MAERTAVSRHKARGRGTSVAYGGNEAGKKISTVPFQLVTGRNWRGTAVCGRNDRTDVPKIIEIYMNGKIEIDPMITLEMGLKEISIAIDLMSGCKSITFSDRPIGKSEK